MPEAPGFLHHQQECAGSHRGGMRPAQLGGHAANRDSGGRESRSTTHSLLEKYGAQARKPRSTRVTKRAVSLFARPGMALDSWMKVGSFMLPAGEDRRRRGEAAHAEDYRRAKFAIGTFAIAIAFPGHAAESGRRPATAGQGMPSEGSLSRPEVGWALQAYRVDFFFGNDQRALRARVPSSSLRHSETGKEMSARSPQAMTTRVGFIACRHFVPGAKPATRSSIIGFPNR